MKLHNLNLNHLYYFWLIATEGSIRKAADKIHLTQPTLSDQIKTLEQQLGEDLFERKNNKLHLTLFGQRVYQHCSQMFSEGEKIIEEIAGGKKRKLKIGVVPDVSKHLIAEVLGPLLKEELFFISIIEAEYVHLLKELESDRLDILISDSSDENLKKIFIQRKIKDRDFVAVCRKKPRKKKEYPKILEELPFISYTEESNFHLHIERYFRKNKLKVETLCEVDDTYLMKIFTGTTNAFSILPRQLVEKSVKKGELAILGEIPSLKADLTLIYKDLEHNNEIFNNFFFQFL